MRFLLIIGVLQSDMPDLTAMPETTVVEQVTEETVTEISSETVTETSQVTTEITEEISGEVSEDMSVETVSETETYQTVPEIATTENLQDMQDIPLDITQYADPQVLAAMGIFAFAAIGALAAKAKKASKTSEGGSARERDRKRLEANRPAKKKKSSKKAKKEKKNRSKTVLDTIPYKKVLDDNIFFLGGKKYSKAYTFDDINFNLADEEQQ